MSLSEDFDALGVRKSSPSPFMESVKALKPVSGFDGGFDGPVRTLRISNAYRRLTVVPPGLLIRFSMNSWNSNTESGQITRGGPVWVLMSTLGVRSVLKMVSLSLHL
jgi:hypothetical protein